MKYAPITQTELKELFKKNIALDMVDLVRKTGSSRTTILRRLKEIGYLTSYDHNGKYFALPEFLTFDESGSFEHKGIHFFKNGGLQELIKYDSPELNQIVPPYSNFAYDVSIHIGFLRFLHHKQKSEIQQELKIKYGIQISEGEITHLSDNFLIYCMCVQMMTSSRIKKVQDERGGYILHIDATVEEESDMVFVGMNSVNGWVLYARKIKRMYGEPLAIKRDMGKGMALAVSKVFPYQQ